MIYRRKGTFRFLLTWFWLYWTDFIEFATVAQHGDRGSNRTNVPIDINPFITHPAHERLYYTTGVYAPYSLRTEQQCGFFYVPQESEQWKSCKMGPAVSRPYPRWLECLTICRCHNKGGIFSSIILRPWGLVRPGFEPTTSRSADRRLINWPNRAAILNAKALLNPVAKRAVRLTCLWNSSS